MGRTLKSGVWSLGCTAPMWLSRVAHGDPVYRQPQQELADEINQRTKHLHNDFIPGQRNCPKVQVVTSISTVQSAP